MEMGANHETHEKHESGRTMTGPFLFVHFVCFVVPSPS